METKNDRDEIKRRRKKKYQKRSGLWSVNCFGSSLKTKKLKTSNSSAKSSSSSSIIIPCCDYDIRRHELVSCLPKKIYSESSFSSSSSFLKFLYFIFWLKKKSNSHNNGSQQVSHWRRDGARHLTRICIKNHQKTKNKKKKRKLS